MLKKPHTLKKCQVVMLPTNEKAIIHLNNNICCIHLEPTHKYDIGQPQHLYFTSDDEIKEGDWYITSDNKILQCEKTFMGLIYAEKDYGRNPNSCKKTVVTTDNSIWEHDDTVPYPKTRPALPQPSQSFIQKYVEEYNKGNIITDVLVEYEKIATYCNDGNPCNCSGSPIHCIDKRNGWKESLKVNPKDNTITIKKVKDSYSRDEVIRLLINHTINLRNKTNDLDFTNNWIQKNL